MKKKNVKNIWDKTIPPEKSAYNWVSDPILYERSKKPDENKLHIVDLFCGPGGFSQGFSNAGFQSVLGVDIHKPSADTFHRNHPTAAVILGDMHKVSDDLIIQSVGDARVDVVAAGVPCQGFSLCNRKRNESDERNFLFMQFIRVVKLLKPKFVVLENVSGMVSSKNGFFVKEICKAIQEAGYPEVDVRLLNALEYGVPQLRRRLFFVGTTANYEIRWPAPTHGIGLKPVCSTWDAIGDLPPLKPGQTLEEYSRPPKTEYQKKMRGRMNSLQNHEAPNHPEETVKKIGETKPGEPIYEKFKQRIRLHPERPSPTQVSGGIRPQFQFGHPTQARGLSIRERARLQSFPDSYFFCGGVVQGRMQTGNAVPPFLAQAIAKQISDILNGKPSSKDALQKSPHQLEFAVT